MPETEGIPTSVVASDLEIAFVSAPNGSIFMAEILDVVADAVQSHGVRVVRHRGVLSEVAAPDTVFVVVPHEYFVVAGPASATTMRRTISFGVEHPGTATFDTAVRYAAQAAARFEISRDSVAELGRQGYQAQHFPLGYSRRWDRWKRRDTGPTIDTGRAIDTGRTIETGRSIDLAYLGTADPDRLRLLAAMGADLSRVRAELFLPPHEPMTGERWDFLPAEAKWRLLSDSRVLLNLHREGKAAFEWVRCLEAICNGCVVLTEPSTDLAPLIAGQHLMVAERSRIGLTLRAILADPNRLQSMAAEAYDFVKAELDMSGPALSLIDAAERARQSPAPRQPVAYEPQRPAQFARPMAEWVPVHRRLPNLHGARDPELATALGELASLRARTSRPTHTPGRRPSNPDAVDVICVRRPGDGPMSLTLDALTEAGAETNRFVAFADGTPQPTDEVLNRVTGCLTFTEPIGRGVARNLLLDQGGSRFVLVLDSGDAPAPGSLARLAAELDANDNLDVAYHIATLASEMLMNVLVPESRRLKRFAYLTRGYLVRRSWLDELDLFAEQPEIEAFVDHDFWSRTAACQRAVAMIRNVGMTLWRQQPGPQLSDVDPAPAAMLLSARAARVADSALS